MATFTVTNNNDSGAGTLRDAIIAANGASGADTIVFAASGTITLASDLPQITDSLLIDGSSVPSGTLTIDGASLYRVFYARSGQTTLQDLTIAHGLAQGGNGGGGFRDGGGGAGLGGGLFVDSGASVNLLEVTFTDNSAMGGSAGSTVGSLAGGGGGGMDADGGAAAGGAGGDGGAGGGPNGGAAGPGPGGAGTGGAGGDYSGGGGGATGQSGGAGGFGGGGGAAGAGAAGGAGGFGGGGGNGSLGGGGAGGYGAGAGVGGGSGGGAGLGGAVFVRSGGTLTMADVAFGGGLVTGGSGFNSGGNGQGQGQGLFLMGGGTVTYFVDLGSSITLSDTIASDGFLSLNKTGLGTLVLDSVSTFANGVSVTGGTLSVSNAAQFGGLMQVNVDLGAALEFRATTAVGNFISIGGGGGIIKVDANQTVSLGFVVGMGTLTKSGAGTLALTHAGTHGATTLAAGVLEISDGDALGTGALRINGGTLRADGNVSVANAVLFGAQGTIDTNGFDLTLTNDLSGVGGLTKTGTGTLVLTGIVNYSSGTTISAGTLQIGDGAAAGGVTGDITNNATLKFDQTGSLTYSGNLSGTGDLVKTGAGILVLGGNNSYLGDTTVSEGVLRVGGTTLDDSGTVTVESGAVLNLITDETIGGLEGGGNVVIDSTADLSLYTISASIFAGQVSGAGGLIKVGSSMLILSGVSTYGGETTLTEGELRVTGSITSAITVETGAVLSGTGTVRAVSVQSGGALSPGASPGVLSTGDLSLAAGSTLRIELAGTGAGQFDQVDVTGTVDLGGATLDLDFTGYAPAGGDSFVIIANDGPDTVTGTFGGLAEGATVAIAGNIFKISYHGGDGNDVTLTASGGGGGGNGGGPTTPVTPPVIAAAGLALGVDLTSAKAQAATVTLPSGIVIDNPLHAVLEKVTAIQAQYAAGLVTETQVKGLLADLAFATKGVAIEGYSFFTGAPPSAEGLAYLIDSTANGTDLTDPYYAGFSTQNRYINFAVNLGASGAGKEAFQAAYGALTFQQAVAKAYDAIIGVDLARIVGYDPIAGENYVVSQKGYFEALGGSDLGAKAAMVGYLLSVGVDARLGHYYQDAFNAIAGEVHLVASPTGGFA